MSILSNIFKQDKGGLIEKADKLVYAANFLATSMREPLEKKYPIIKQIDEEKFITVLTVAHVYWAVQALGSIKPKPDKAKRDELLKIIESEIIRWNSNGSTYVKDCAAFVERGIRNSTLADLESNKQLANDLLGTWAVWNLTGSSPSTDDELNIVRFIGVAVSDYMLAWWRV